MLDVCDFGLSDLRRVAMGLLPKLAGGYTVLRAEPIVSARLFSEFRAALDHQRDEDESLLAEAQVAVWHAEAKAREAGARGAGAQGAGARGAAMRAKPDTATPVCRGVALSEGSLAEWSGAAAAGTTGNGAVPVGAEPGSPISSDLVSCGCSTPAVLVATDTVASSAVLGGDETSDAASGDALESTQGREALDWEASVASSQAASGRFLSARLAALHFRRRHRTLAARFPSEVGRLAAALRDWAGRRATRRAEVSAVRIQSTVRGMLARLGWGEGASIGCVLGRARRGGQGAKKERGRALLERMLERMRSPILAFHATPSQQGLEAISAEGLLSGGEVSARTGEVLAVSHGARFGDGRYLSPSLGVSDAYGFGDASGKRQVLLCLVALGRTEKLVCEEDASLRPRDWHLSRCRRCEAPLCDGLACRLEEARSAVRAWEAECTAADARGTSRARDSAHMAAAKEAVATAAAKEGSATAAETATATAKAAAKAAAATATKGAVATASAIKGAAATATVAEAQAAGEAGRVKAPLAERGKRLYARVAKLEEEQQAATAFRTLPGGYHSRISPDGLQFVVSREQMVLPLLRVTYEPPLPVDTKQSGVYLGLQPVRGAQRKTLIGPIGHTPIGVSPTGGAPNGNSRRRRLAREALAEAKEAEADIEGRPHVTFRPLRLDQVRLCGMPLRRNVHS